MEKASEVCTLHLALLAGQLIFHKHVRFCFTESKSRCIFFLGKICSKEPGPHRPLTSHSFSSFAVISKWSEHKQSDACRNETNNRAAAHWLKHGRLKNSVEPSKCVQPISILKHKAPSIYNFREFDNSSPITGGHFKGNGQVFAVVQFCLTDSDSCLCVVPLWKKSKLEPSLCKLMG